MADKTLVELTQNNTPAKTDIFYEVINNTDDRKISLDDVSRFVLRESDYGEKIYSIVSDTIYTLFTHSNILIDCNTAVAARAITLPSIAANVPDICEVMVQANGANQINLTVNGGVVVIPSNKSVRYSWRDSVWVEILTDTAHSLDYQSRSTDSNPNTIAGRDASGNIKANVIESDAPTGTAPFTPASTTVCPNLNADMVDGYHITDIYETTVDPYTFKPSQMITALDLHSIRKSGLYNGANVTNAPDVNWWYYIINVHDNPTSNYIKIIAYRLNSDDPNMNHTIYQKNCQDGSWSRWARLTDNVGAAFHTSQHVYASVDVMTTIVADVTSGIRNTDYWFYSDCSNLPAAGVWNIKSYAWASVDPNFIKLMAYNFVSAASYEKHREGGTWSPWVQLTDNNGNAVNTDAIYDTRLGSSYTSSGGGNVGIGFNALYNNVSGYNNVAVGAGSLFGNIDGHNNTCVGNGANASSSLIYATSIGSGAYVSSSTTIRMGRTSTDTLKGYNYTADSDIRLKENIEPLNIGLEFIKKLKPVFYKWKSRKIKRGDDKNEEIKFKRKHAGFIAQDIGKLLKDENIDFGLYQDSGINNKIDKEIEIDFENFKEPCDLKGYVPEQMIPILVKAVQELSAQVLELKSRLDSHE